MAGFREDVGGEEAHPRRARGEATHSRPREGGEEGAAQGAEEAGAEEREEVEREREEGEIETGRTDAGSFIFSRSLHREVPDGIELLLGLGWWGIRDRGRIGIEDGSRLGELLIGEIGRLVRHDGLALLLGRERRDDVRKVLWREEL